MRHRALCVSLLSVVLSGCHGWQAAVNLDRVAQSVDQYGFASISTPFLAGPSDEFAFDLDKSAAEYFDLAFQPQGGIRNFAATAFSAQFAFRANVEAALATLMKFQKVQSLTQFRIAKAQAATQKKMLESLAGSTPGLSDSPQYKSLVGLLGVASEAEEPDLPEFEPSSTDLPDVGPVFEPEQLQSLKAVGGEFTDGLDMPDGPFKISAREALLIAGGDVTTQSLLRWFHRPARNKLKEYELFVCPMVVSVQPGYQTREDYVADVTVNVDLARLDCTCSGGKPGDRAGGTGCGCKGLHYLSDEFQASSPPILVAGVFPMVDAQVLNVVNSRRKLYSLALQLSMMGFGAQADFFSDFAERIEQDAETATTLTAASAYTVGDTAFGFRIEPKLVAGDFADVKKGPDRVLESRSFPALAAVLVDRKYLHKRPGVAGTCEKPQDHFDYVVFETSTRWAPMDSGGAIWPGRLSEVEMWRRAEKLDHAQAHITKVEGDSLRRQRNHLDRRINSLERLAIDSRAVVRVFDTGPAANVEVTSVVPKEGWWDQYTVITLTGTGFRGNIEGVTVGGILCDFSVPNDRTLLVAVPPWGKAKAELPKTHGDLSSLSSNMPINSGSGVISNFHDSSDDDSAKVNPGEIALASKVKVSGLDQVTLDFSRCVSDGDAQKPGGTASKNKSDFVVSRDAAGRIVGIDVRKEGLDVLKILELIGQSDCRGAEGSFDLSIDASGATSGKAGGGG